MWTPGRLIIINLITHEKTVFDFKTQKTILLLGKNKTQQVGANSNGSGKSAIVNGVSLAITGITGRDVNKEDYIRWGQESCIVSLDLINSVLNKKMLIRRTIYQKKAQEILLKINGEIKFNTKIDKNLALAEKFIISEIGIAQNDLFDYFLIHQGSNSSFFTSNDTKQKEIIGRFSNFTQIDDVVKKFDKESEELEKERDLITNKITVTKESLKQLEEDLIELKENFKQEKQNALELLLEDISEYEEKEKANQEKIEQFENAIKETQRSIDKEIKKLIDVSELKEEKRIERENKTELEEKLKIAIKALAKVNSYKGGILQCPECRHQFNPNEEFKLKPKQIDSAIFNKELEIKNLEKNKDDSVKIIESLTAKINGNSTIGNEIDSLKRAKQRYKNLLQDHIDTDEQHKGTISNLKNKYNLLKKQKNPDDSVFIERKQKNEKLLEEQEIKLEDVRIKSEESAFYKFHFSNKGFKTFLANKSIRSIQDLVNHYLKKVDIGLQVSIKGTTELKSGESRDKISICVLGDGKIKNFKTFSGGERIRLIVCSYIAFNALINNSMEYGKGLDLLIIDELAHLDSKGTEKIVEILSKSNITSLLILQFAEDIDFENVLTVKKVGGISKITTL